MTFSCFSLKHLSGKQQVWLLFLLALSNEPGDSLKGSHRGCFFGGSKPHSLLSTSKFLLGHLPESVDPVFLFLGLLFFTRAGPLVGWLLPPLDALGALRPQRAALARRGPAGLLPAAGLRAVKREQARGGADLQIHMAVGQNQRYHFGVGEFTTHVRTHFSGDWDVHWGHGLLTRGHVEPHVGGSISQKRRLYK